MSLSGQRADWWPVETQIILRDVEELELLLQELRLVGVVGVFEGKLVAQLLLEALDNLVAHYLNCKRGWIIKIFLNDGVFVR